MKKRALAGLVSLALAATAGSAAAQDAKSPVPASPWYIGIGIGRTNASIPDQTINSANAILSGPTAYNPDFTVVDEDKTSTGLKFLAGYRFMRNFAVEGGYAVVGQSKVDMDFRVGLDSIGSFNMEYKMTAMFIDAVGILPFADKWSLIGRVGVAYGRTSVSFGGGPISLISSNDDKTDSKVREKFGAGVDYDVNQKMTVRGEWERYKMTDPFSDDTINADTATLSFLFRF